MHAKLKSMNLRQKILSIRSMQMGEAKLKKINSLLFCRGRMSLMNTPKKNLENYLGFSSKRATIKLVLKI